MYYKLESIKAVQQLLEYPSKNALNGWIKEFEKIAFLPAMMILYKQKLTAQNNFKKNKVECAFATTDNVYTLGFAMAGRPKSLLKENKLDKSKSKNVDLIFRKKEAVASYMGTCVGR